MKQMNFKEEYICSKCGHKQIAFDAIDLSKQKTAELAERAKKQPYFDSCLKCGNKEIKQKITIDPELCPR
jgi:predicted RNA-binding Zn-ribbon protein involved in translation (DUF1610 family)